MLAFRGFGTGPRVVGHVDNQVRSVGHEVRTDVPEDILVADGRGERDSGGCREDDRLRALLPPVVVIGLEQIVEPRHLLLIREMLRERNKVLLEVALLYDAVVEEDHGIVVELVPVAFLVVCGLGLVGYDAGRISRQKGYAELCSERDELVHKLLDVAQVIEGVACIIAFVRMCGVPADRRYESSLGPYDHVGLPEAGFQAHPFEVDEVALVCGVASLPRIGVVLDGGHGERSVGFGFLPLRVCDDTVDNLHHQKYGEYDQRDLVEQHVCPQALRMFCSCPAVVVACPVPQECLRKDHHERDSPDSEQVSNLNQYLIVIEGIGDGSVRIACEPSL